MPWSERNIGRGKDKPDFGEGGGLRRALRRIFVEGDDFFSWSLPLFTVAGIRVRIHLLYIIVAVAEMLTPIYPGAMGYAYKAFFLGTMFLFVLLHEFGHCTVCRLVGGDADEILMWPLGGLAACHPPRNWRLELFTTIGGPVVNLVLAAILAGVIVATGATWQAVAINVFDPWQTVIKDEWFRLNAAHWKTLLFSAYIANVYLFLFNVCLPMFPMDGGRILQELLWSRLGYRKSMLIAVNVGLFSAIAVGVLAVTTKLGTGTLFGIAFFCGVTCFLERRKLAMTEEEGWLEPVDVSASARPVKTKPDSYEAKRFREIAAAQERERKQQVEVDRILAKIASEGMGSLSRKERDTLKEATERKRGGA